MLGLARPGEPSAERLYAVVVPNDEVVRERKVANIGDLLRFEMEGASVHLPHHKRVLGYEIWREPLPRTTTGKIKRFEIERRVRAAAQAKETPGGPALSDADRAWLARPDLAPDPRRDRQRRCGRGRSLTPDANLELDLGFDSMERVELLTALEQRFGADVPEEEMQRLYTVRELAESIRQHARSEAQRPPTAPRGTRCSPRIRSSGEAMDQWLKRHYVLPLILFAIVKTHSCCSCALTTRIEATGREKLPARGPYLLSPNHQSYLDPFLVVGCLPYRIVRQFFFVGASEYFADARAAMVCAANQPDPGRSGRQPRLGDAGRRRWPAPRPHPGPFPEGERSIDGTVRTFKKGAAILAHHLHVPIVPVAIDGLFELWGRNRAFQLAHAGAWRGRHDPAESRRSDSARRRRARRCGQRSCVLGTDHAASQRGDDVMGVDRGAPGIAAERRPVS